MSVAALYDIHGNLPALEAVYKEVEQSNVDHLLIGGVLVLGPMSAECFGFSYESIDTNFVYQQEL